MTQSKHQTTSVSCVCTVLNEVRSLQHLLQALAHQTVLPGEVVIVDGGSTDGTWQALQKLTRKQWPFSLNCMQKKGNRSVGRNRAIAAAQFQTICITDAGCLPDVDWIEQLLLAHRQSGQSVIAGYYKGVSINPFEQAVIPYALVMPDRVNPDTFLPATRSMLIERDLWRRMGGFDESLSDNEDYAFARRLRQQKIPIGFTSSAIVQWQPRSSLKSFWTMIFRFARGDAQAQLWRPKVTLIFVRYLLMAGAIIWMLGAQQLSLLAFIMALSTILYSIWAIQKNVRYVPQGWYWLPVLQITSDLAVMSGTLSGILRSMTTIWQSRD